MLTAVKQRAERAGYEKRDKEKDNQQFLNEKMKMETYKKPQA